MAPRRAEPIIGADALGSTELDAVWLVDGDTVEQGRLACREAHYELAIAEATTAGSATLIPRTESPVRGEP